MMESSKSTENLAPSSQNSSNTLLVVVVAIALVVAGIALIIAIVSISQQNITISTVDRDASTADGDASSGVIAAQTEGGSGNDRIWQLAVVHTGNNYGYIDEVTGEFRGMQVDMATAVCQIAGKNCEIVYDSGSRCWASQPGARPQGGEGLMAQYYDTCVGWVKSYERPRTFKFTTAFTQRIISALLVKKGNPNDFVWTNLTNSKLGFISGWAYDEHCIAREKDRIAGWDLSEDQIVRYSGRQTLYDGLIAGEVDAIFDYIYSWIAKDADTDIASDPIDSCALDGFSLMTRKDNLLVNWWNPAFDTLRATSQWTAICNDLLDEHGHAGGPLPEEFCVDYE